MADRLIPGTTIPYSGSSGVFSKFRPLIRATNGLTLGQVCAITGLEYSTVQNWIKRGFVAHPIRKKYYDRHLARILLITSLRDSMKIENIGELMTAVNGDTDDESDDIISEAQLYDYLCEIIGSMSDGMPTVGSIPDLVRRVTRDFEAPDESVSERLNKALEVMVYAYTAGMFKRAADNSYLSLM